MQTEPGTRAQQSARLERTMLCHKEISAIARNINTEQVDDQGNGGRAASMRSAGEDAKP
jgi:hypothetical protein